MLYNTIRKVTNATEHYYTFCNSDDYKISQKYTTYLKQTCKSIMDLIITYNDTHPFNKEQYYTMFHIPKHSGGYRTITAPDEELKSVMRDIKQLIDRLGFIPHDAAYAYRYGRSSIDAVRKHQQYNSKWFLKIDIKSFFPNTTKDILSKYLKQVIPFNIIFEDNEQLNMFIDFCLYEGGLPQGTPLSPLLTNIIMVPFDYHFQSYCWKNNLCYTRYADDLLISSKYEIDVDKVIEHINNLLNNYGYIINRDKIRYGSSAGRNWNLGLMLNKDNKITLGHKKKQRLKAALYNFFRDNTSTPAVRWELEDVYILMGNISYFKSVEPKYCNYLIQSMETKFNITYKELYKLYV